jgi:hypothetical protein
MRLPKLVFCLLITSTAGCTRPTETSTPDAGMRLRAIPAVTDEHYRTTQDLKSWRNPYLIVGTEGVSLLDVSSHEEHRLKMEELAEALANLPSTAWPYGRVVALQEVAVSGSPSDSSKIRENRAKVAAALHTLEIAINYVPSA